MTLSDYILDLMKKQNITNQKDIKEQYYTISIKKEDYQYHSISILDVLNNIEEYNKYDYLTSKQDMYNTISIIGILKPEFFPITSESIMTDIKDYNKSSKGNNVE